MISFMIGTHRDNSYSDVRSFLAGLVAFLAPDWLEIINKRILYRLVKATKKTVRTEFFSRFGKFVFDSFSFKYTTDHNARAKIHSS